MRKCSICENFQDEENFKGSYCIPCMKEYKKQNYEKNKEKIRAQRARRREQILQYKKEYREKNREKIKKYEKVYRKEVRNQRRVERLKTDEEFKVKKNVSHMIYKAMCGLKSGKSAFDFLSYDVETLKKNLESKFQSGMTWDNYGEWHIDHIIPNSFFKYTDMGHEDFKKCWALINLRPMWARENISKSNKLNYDEEQKIVAEQLGITLWKK